MAGKRAKRPVDEEGNPIPPEERWALIDGPWEQPLIHNRWRVFDDFMNEYGPAVDASNGTYFFDVIRVGLNRPEKDPEKLTYGTSPVINRIEERFDEAWLAKHPNGGGGKYNIRFRGPKIDKVSGKENRSDGFIATFYNLQIPGDPNNLPQAKRPRILDDADFDDGDHYADRRDRNSDVASRLVRVADAARQETEETNRLLLEKLFDTSERGHKSDDVTVALAQMLTSTKQSESDSNLQFFRLMMENQQAQLRAQLDMQQNRQPDRSEEIERLMRVLDQTKQDHRAALAEERDRSRAVQEQLRQQYMDQATSLKEDRDRRERELKDELEKTRAELREINSRLEDTRGKLSAVQLEKVSAEVKATLGGNGAGTGLGGIKKTLEEVKAISQLVAPASAGGDDGENSWQSKLVETVSNPQVAQALGSVFGTAVNAIRRPQLGGYTPNPQLPPMQVQQMPDPAQQAWAQQQAYLEAQRQQQALQARPQPQPQSQQATPQAQPATAPVEEDDGEKTFTDLVEDACSRNIEVEDFLREVLGTVNVTVQEARQQTQGQTMEQVLSALKQFGLDYSALSVAGKEYVKEIYHFLQRTV